MRSRLMKALLVVLLATIVPALGHAVTITFDDLPSNLHSIPNGYNGLNWDWQYLDGVNQIPSGYKNGVVSPNNVAYTPFANPSAFWSVANQFTFNSAYLTAAWKDGLNVRVQGFNAGMQLHDVNLTVNTSGPLFAVFDWSGIDRVLMTPSGGVPHGYVGSSPQLVMDNLTINQAAPEPASLTLLGTGLIGLIGFARRRLS